MTLTWEQKFAAIIALTGPFGASLKMREPGDWYVATSGVEIKKRSMLAGTASRGKTPQEAVEDHWARWTDQIDGEYLVVNAMAKERRAVRWNGFMWETVLEASSFMTSVAEAPASGSGVGGGAA